MSLETVSGALLLFYIILFPIAVLFVALIAYSVRYWLEKRKEKRYPNVYKFTPNLKVEIEVAESEEDEE